MDFDKSIIYDTNILPLVNFDSNNTLITNILKTLYECARLLINEDKQKLRQSIDKSLNESYHYDLIESQRSRLRTLYNGNRALKDVIQLHIHEMIYFINNIWKDIYNEYLFPSYSLDYKP